MSEHPTTGARETRVFTFGGLGEFVEKADYDALAARVEALEAAATKVMKDGSTNSWAYSILRAALAASGAEEDTNAGH